MKKYLNHNARSDKILSPRGWWKKPFESRRCLIPASGYYEKEDPNNPKKKQRYYFTRRNGEPMAFAGMWDHHAGMDLTSATMITTEPNEYVAACHDRMPAILSPQEDAWLAEPRFDLLKPAPVDDLTAIPVRSDIKDDDPAGSVVVNAAVG